MEEHQVTAEGETRRLPEPFFVVATQNPSHLVGTFPLPESQLDRFLMRIELGYPDRDAERELLEGADRRDMIAGIDACLAAGELVRLQSMVKAVHVAPPLLDYIQALVEHSRRSPEYATGLSPRAALALLHASQAYNFYQWVFGRHAPEPGVVFLSQRRVFILPTRHGLSFGGSLVLMLLGSINYSLSLGYVLTFLLAGLGVVSILHTFRNLAHLYVSAGRVSPVFAGDSARFQLVFENRSGFDRHSLDSACRGATASCDAPAHRHSPVALPLKAEKRGWLQLERVTVETRFPLGLMRAWSYVQPDMRALVYPRPDSAPLPLPYSDAHTGDAISSGAGTDDFSGLRPYQASDSPRHIAWKASARSELLLTKLFEGRATSELWFDWTQLPADMHTEERLSRLARWVLLAEERGLRYGLKLPDAEVPLGEGFAHRERCLKELALFHG